MQSQNRKKKSININVLGGGNSILSPRKGMILIQMNKKLIKMRNLWKTPTEEFASCPRFISLL